MLVAACHIKFEGYNFKKVFDDNIFLLTKSFN